MVQLTRPPPPAWPRTKQEHDIAMAKWEIHKRAGNLYDSAWWHLMPGVTISVAWPVGKVFLVDCTQRGHTGIGVEPQEVESADPNDHYRPFLEKNVGRQGWDWNWGLRDNNSAENKLTIKVRKKHGKWATMMTLIWN